jgi:hypothetical protein
MVRPVGRKPRNSPEWVPRNRSLTATLVRSSEDVLDVRLQVGERVLHHLETLLPHLSPVLRFGQFSQVDDEVRGHVGHALVSVAGVESLESGAH